MAKKSIKKLWKEKAQGKYHIGCIFPNDTPYGNYGDKKCYLSKVKKNGEYEFVTDHTYAKDFSEQKADELLKKLQDEFGGKIKNESLSSKRINESYRNEVWWDADADYEFWMNEASDDEVLTEYCEHNNINEDEVEPPYAKFDDEDNIIEYDYDKMREWICDDDGMYRNDQWEILRQDIDYEISNQFVDDTLIIDDYAIRSSGTDMFNFIADKVEDYYGGGKIYLDEDGNIEDWYTIPTTESARYRLARNIPEVVDDVKSELKYREEHEDEEDEEDLYFNSQDYAGLSQKELWLAVLDDWLREPDQIDWGYVDKEYLVPIHP